MATLVVPISKVDDTDEGQYAATTVAEDTIALPGGLYKIAAVGAPLTWKIGDNAVDNTKGSYLAAGDQELVRIPKPVSPATDIPLRFIRAADAAADGQINVVVVELFEAPGVDSRPYLVPA